MIYLSIKYVYSKVELWRTRVGIALTESGILLTDEDSNLAQCERKCPKQWKYWLSAEKLKFN